MLSHQDQKQLSTFLDFLERQQKAIPKPDGLMNKIRHKKFIALLDKQVKELKTMIISGELPSPVDYFISEMLYPFQNNTSDPLLGKVYKDLVNVTETTMIHLECIINHPTRVKSPDTSMMKAIAENMQRVWGTIRSNIKKAKEEKQNFDALRREAFQTEYRPKVESCKKTFTEILSAVKSKLEPHAAAMKQLSEEWHAIQKEIDANPLHILHKKKAGYEKDLDAVTQVGVKKYKVMADPQGCSCLAYGRPCDCREIDIEEPINEPNTVTRESARLALPIVNTAILELEMKNHGASKKLEDLKQKQKNAADGYKKEHEQLNQVKKLYNDVEDVVKKYSEMLKELDEIQYKDIPAFEHQMSGIYLHLADVYIDIPESRAQVRTLFKELNLKISTWRDIAEEHGIELYIDEDRFDEVYSSIEDFPLEIQNAAIEPKPVHALEPSAPPLALLRQDFLPATNPAANTNKLSEEKQDSVVNSSNAFVAEKLSAVMPMRKEIKFDAETIIPSAPPLADVQSSASAFSQQKQNDPSSKNDKDNRYKKYTKYRGKPKEKSASAAKKIAPGIYS